MNAVYNTYKPPGFSTVNSYLSVEEPVALIEFLKNAFYAEELQRTLKGDGDIANCIMQIGESCFMVSQAKAPFLNMKTAFYLYVNDVDTLHKNAIALDGKEVFPPADTSRMRLHS